MKIFQQLYNQYFFTKILRSNRPTLEIHFWILVVVIANRVIVRFN
jgi:hypothetical protein